jgi:two-component system response regulator
MENTVEIVLVEDNMYDAQMTIRALKKIGNNITHLKDGAEALDFLFGTGQYQSRNPDIQPRVILLDLKMPKVNGMEVLRELKSNASTKAIPVVILTSSKEDPDIKLCYDLGANSYIVKPVGFENFAKSISELGFYWMILNQPGNR